jgi:hypothetical protein
MGAKKHVRQSETVRFITKYVPEFLKHFRGSLKIAKRRSPFKISPTIGIARTGISL